MANCAEMNVGEVYHCEVCGLEMAVKKACTVPLQCCGQEMKKKS
ncbi:MAG: hypothetical protein ACLFPR_14540 [Desulfococcaceae bacterium]